MNTRVLSQRLAFAAVMAILPLTACNQQAGNDDSGSGMASQAEPSQTLASALNDVEGMDTLNKAVSGASLGPIFDGPGSYTLLAPTDDAFATLGKDGQALLNEDQRPMLTALLREHIVPGHLTHEAIDKAIVEKGGPVTMKTMGGGEVTFSKDGDVISVANEGGAKAKLGSTATTATNGAILPVGAVLLPPKEA